MSNSLQIIYIIISVLIIILVLAQKAKDNGFSTMTGASSNGGREIGKTFEKKLQNWTTWLVVVYILFSIVFTFIQLKSSKAEQDAFTSDDIYQVEAETLNESETEEPVVENVAE